MTGRHKYMPLIVEIILLELTSTFSTPAAATAQCFDHLRFSCAFSINQWHLD